MAKCTSTSFLNKQQYNRQLIPYSNWQFVIDISYVYAVNMYVFIYFVRPDVMNSLNFPASQFYWNSNLEYILSNESIICYYSSTCCMRITLSRPSTSQLSTKNVFLYYLWCFVLVLIFLFYFRPKTNLECYNWDVIF